MSQKTSSRLHNESKKGASRLGPLSRPEVTGCARSMVSRPAPGRNAVTSRSSTCTTTCHSWSRKQRPPLIKNKKLRAFPKPEEPRPLNLSFQHGTREGFDRGDGRDSGLLPAPRHRAGACGRLYAARSEQGARGRSAGGARLCWGTGPCHGSSVWRARGGGCPGGREGDCGRAPGAGCARAECPRLVLPGQLAVLRDPAAAAQLVPAHLSAAAACGYLLGTRAGDRKCADRGYQS